MHQAVDIEDLSAAWLSNALGYQIRSLATQRVGTGQTGAAYRLTIDAGQGPQTILAKVGAGEAVARKQVAHAYASEVGFYSQLAETVDVRVPHCYYAGITNDALCFTLLLEDLAPRKPGVQVEACDAERARGALRNLAGLHAPRWNDASLFDLEFLVSIMEEERAAFLAELTKTACAQFVERFRDELGADNVETMRSGGDAIANWATALQEPFAPVHGDYRLDNLMFGNDAQDVVALDWQTIAIGPPTRDLAYFLGTCLEVEERRRTEADLVGLYHKELLRRGIEGYEFDQCFRDYRLGQLQATMITSIGCMLATGERSKQADEMFLAMARRSCAAIRDLGTLDLI